MSTEPPALGKGVFGYRKSAVNQIIADRDTMLRQAEGRVRAAEGKVSSLESELVGVQQRNQRMEEQLERLRQQVTALMGASPLAADAIAAPEEPPPASEGSMPQPEPAPEVPQAPDAEEADAPPAYEISPSVQDEAGSEAWAASPAGSGRTGSSRASGCWSSRAPAQAFAGRPRPIPWPKTS